MAADPFNLEFLSRREVAGWPAGDNDTDTIFGGNHFNITTLEDWNYLYYSNETISNGSKCWLTFEPHQPVELFTNGSFLNATTCYIATNPVGTRGIIGIGFAAAFFATIVLILTCLTKHGALYLPTSSRFYPIGRRWQWYWGSFICACGVISLLLNIDVDRYYLQELPIIVTVFFYYLMCMGVLAMTWEAVRHWGSWQERQFIDPNPFILDQSDGRAKLELLIPLFFYFCVWMNFFLTIPRNWEFAWKQRSPEQAAEKCIPEATGARFKAAAFALFIAWCTIIFSLWHSIRHYKPRNRGIFNRVIGFFGSIPLRFVILIPMCLAVIAYQALIAWDFNWSLVKVDGPLGIIYGWGYGVPLVMCWIQIVYGWANTNEDKELIAQRRIRGELADNELGLTRKPAWWRRVKGEHIKGTFRDQLLKNVREVGHTGRVGRRAEGDMERDIRTDMEASARDEDGNNVELRSMRRDDANPFNDRPGVPRQGSHRSIFTGGPTPQHQSNDRALSLAAGLLFPDGEEVARRDKEQEAERRRRLEYISGDGLDRRAPPPYSESSRATEPMIRPSNTGRSNSNSSSANSISSPPQRIRSMLDL